MDYQTKLHSILTDARDQGVSDVHLTAGYSPVFRRVKNLEEQKGDVLLASDTKELARVLMTQEQWEEFLEQKQIDLGYEMEDKGRFRVNVFFERGKVCIAARLIPEEIKTVEQLNLPTVLHQLTTAQQGLVLVTGASSQGKSTTLASLVDEINHNRKDHIITIEDPIEYVFEDDKCLVAQREVGRDALDFASALRSTLREDPDVIMVGEMRDLETITTALQAAETGHLVFSTLHTNSAAQTVHRIIDVFPSGQQSQIRAQLAGSLLAVVAQRLVPGIETDFVPACEVMFDTSAVANLIRENKIHELPGIMETSRADGMRLLNSSLKRLVEEEQITRDNALRYSLRPKELAARL